ncbi:MAG TPA: glycosyltransferase family 2 protein [Patescibacteria group bacterium]|nr:glycosyltransferase family 2 protein [Patescibacteria group bacterium]
MRVSVIIPVYNEEKVILECLKSLDKQFEKDFEVILVDDGSTDDTLKIISEFKSKKYKIIVLKQNHEGPAIARNLGAKYSKGKILVFVDSDMTFSENFLGELVGPIREGKTNGTFSKLEYVKNKNNIWAKCWGINQGWLEGMRHPRDYPDQQKVFRAILKSEFEKVNGFSKGGYTDDYTLSDKLGYQAIAAKAVFYHENPDNLKEVFEQAKWSAKRKYKMGFIGELIATLRSFILISIIAGLLKWFDILGLFLIFKKNEIDEPKYSFKNYFYDLLNRFVLAIGFLVFKIVYDFGIFVGILEMMFTGKTAK